MSVRPGWRSGRVPRVPAALARDERGFVLVFAALALPVMIGLVGLALDGVRLLALDTELAARADAAALAAASRLDRSAGALAAARRAALAAANGTAGNPVGLSFRFAASLADLRLDASGRGSDVAAGDATVVEVRTGATGMTASLLGLVGARVPTLSRSATAQSLYYACDVTPLALCQPNPAAFVAAARRGRQYLLRADGNVVAGSVALLEPADAASPRAALATLADDRPAFCYADRVRRRGDVVSPEFDEALNVRFDRYTGRNGPIRPDLALYPPAPIVLTGRHLDTCRSSPDGGDINPPFPLPRDAVFQGFIPSAPWNAGMGDWRVAPPLGGTGAPVRTALDEYMLWNHADGGVGAGTRMRDAPTRWDLYLAELGLTRATETRPVDTRSLGASAASVPSGGPSTGPFSLRRENAVPICYGGPRAATQARRRILYMTVTDCAALGEGSRAADLSRRVAKFFLTEASDAGRLLVEFVDFVRPEADDGKLRHVVQLVRTD